VQAACDLCKLGSLDSCIGGSWSRLASPSAGVEEVGTAILSRARKRLSDYGSADNCEDDSDAFAYALTRDLEVTVSAGMQTDLDATLLSPSRRENGEKSLVVAATSSDSLPGSNGVVSCMTPGRKVHLRTLLRVWIIAQAFNPKDSLIKDSGEADRAASRSSTHSTSSDLGTSPSEFRNTSGGLSAANMRRSWSMGRRGSIAPVFKTILAGVRLKHIFDDVQNVQVHSRNSTKKLATIKEDPTAEALADVGDIKPKALVDVEAIKPKAAAVPIAVITLETS